MGIFDFLKLQKDFSRSSVRSTDSSNIERFSPSHLTIEELCKKITNIKKAICNAQMTMHEDEFCTYLKKLLQEDDVEFDHNDICNYYPRITFRNLPLFLDVQVNCISTKNDVEIICSSSFDGYDFRIYLYDYHLNNFDLNKLSVGMKMKVKGIATIAGGEACVSTNTYKPEMVLSYSNFSVDYDGDGFELSFC